MGEKIKNFLKRYWLFIFLAGLIGFLIFLRLSPRETPLLPSKPLNLIFTTPNQGSHETIWSSYPVKFNFDQPVKKDSLNYQITPFQDSFVTIEDEGKAVAIYPKPGWSLRTNYRITITQLESEEGKLTQPIDYSFRVNPPETHDVW